MSIVRFLAGVINSELGWQKICDNGKGTLVKAPHCRAFLLGCRDGDFPVKIFFLLVVGFRNIYVQCRIQFNRPRWPSCTGCPSAPLSQELHSRQCSLCRTNGAGSALRTFAWCSANTTKLLGPTLSQPRRLPTPLPRSSPLPAHARVASLPFPFAVAKTAPNLGSLPPRNLQ